MSNETSVSRHLPDDLHIIDKRVTTIETTVNDLTQDFRDLSTVVKDFAREIKVQVSEMQRPNYNFMGILATIITAVAAGLYVLIYTPIDKQTTKMEVQMQVMYEQYKAIPVLQRETEHLREIIELKMQLLDKTAVKKDATHPG